MPGPDAGRRSPQFRRLRLNLMLGHPPCWLCGQAIDYDQPDPHHPDAFTVDHAKPLSTHPHLAEDPGNLRPAHKRCNSARGNREPRPGLGDGPRQW